MRNVISGKRELSAATDDPLEADLIQLSLIAAGAAIGFGETAGT